MPILHMQTEQVRSTGQQLTQAANTLREQSQSCSRAAQALDWQGPSRDIFVSELGQVAQSLSAAAEQGAALGVRVQREADEWEQVDSRFGDSGVVGGGSGAAAGAGAGAAPATTGTDIYASREAFREHWDGLSVDERRALLQDLHNQIAREYGMEPQEIQTPDLPDPAGMDWRGVRRADSIGIDIDNVRDDDPFRVIETLAHESRHSIQHHLVENPDARPDHISQEQVQAWDANFKNYISSRDDFQGYRDQPVERDAREFGGSFVNDLFRNN